jgi:hypothetical protein
MNTFILLCMSMLGQAFFASGICQERAIILALDTEEAKTSAEVCVTLRAADFQRVVAMQYSLHWEHAKLRFRGVESFGLPGLEANNFGLHRTAEGLLTFVWLDNTLRGVDLPDGAAIYQVCFEVKGKRGEKARVFLANWPTPFEAVDADERLLRIDALEGGVIIR